MTKTLKLTNKTPRNTKKAQAPKAKAQPKAQKAPKVAKAPKTPKTPKVVAPVVIETPVVVEVAPVAPAKPAKRTRAMFVAEVHARWAGELRAHAVKNVESKDYAWDRVDGMTNEEITHVFLAGKKRFAEVLQGARSILRLARTIETEQRAAA